MPSNSPRVYTGSYYSRACSPAQYHCIQNTSILHEVPETAMNQLSPTPCPSQMVQDEGLGPNDQHRATNVPRLHGGSQPLLRCKHLAYWLSVVPQALIASNPKPASSQSTAQSLEQGLLGGIHCWCTIPHHTTGLALVEAALNPECRTFASL